MREPRPLPFRIGARERALLAIYHAPRDEAARPCGVVLLNPIGDDTVRAHRPLRHLAERLAHAGFPALRFDFHGTGDSAGDERLPDRVRLWREDVQLAAAALRARSGATDVALVGLRLGATLAAAAAAEAGGVDALVLWGPFATGRAYVAESTRLHEMHRKLEPQSFAGGPKSRADGEEAFGFLLTRGTIAELAALDLGALGAPPARRALVLGDGSGAAAEEALGARLHALGVAVERRVLAESRRFLVEIPHKSRLPEEALGAIVVWLCEAYPAPANLVSLQPAPAPAPAPAPGSGAGEREREREREGVGEATQSTEHPILFGHRHPLFGILHVPPSPLRSRTRPPILLSNAGAVHRIGPHRFYVKLARRWAALGFPVLRLDLSGIGDSPAADDGIENVTYPRDGLLDLGEAMDWLAAQDTLLLDADPPRFLVAGLCSGGDFAFQAARSDPRVAGAVLLNPRTFCVNDLAAVETGNPPGVLAAAGKVAGLAEPEPVPAALRRMVERGVDTLLVVSERDPGVSYVDERWGDAMRALRDLPGFRREDVPGTDHNFTSLWAQETVSDLVTEHLERRYAT